MGEVFPHDVTLDVVDGKAVARHEDGRIYEGPYPKRAEPEQSNAEPQAAAQQEEQGQGEGEGDEPYRLDPTGFQSMSDDFMAGDVAGVSFEQKGALVQFVTRCLQSGSEYTEEAVREHLISPHFGLSTDQADKLIDYWYEAVGKKSGPKTSAMSKDAAKVELKKLRAPGSAYWDRRSPQHQNARDRVSKLYAAIYGEEGG